MQQYNRPTANEIAALMIDNFDPNNQPASRDIIVQSRGGGLQRIKETHAAYDPLQYPLLFPHGDLGWDYSLEHSNNPPNAGQNNKVTVRQFAAYRLHPRSPQDGFIHWAGRLFHQYIVDQYAKIEQTRLSFIRHNQRKIRADVYQGLADMLHSNQPLANTGKRIILPSSFTGGQRFMMQNYQDAMALVREYGKPDLFITATCNPNWPEIRQHLYNTQQPSDRPDIVARVFRLKLKGILHDLFTKQVLGDVVASVYVTEFQKRGLPHAHILMILAQHHKPLTTEDYDKFVSAEIPDPVSQPDLYECNMRRNKIWRV